jgi:endonuclease/exonuclease/phosphatase family metal-dependent hydrolase
MLTLYLWYAAFFADPVTVVQIRYPASRTTITTRSGFNVFYALPANSPLELRRAYKLLEIAERDVLVTDALQLLRLEYVQNERRLEALRTARLALYLSNDIRGPQLRYFDPSVLTPFPSRLKAGVSRGLTFDASVERAEIAIERFFAANQHLHEVLTAIAYPNQGKAARQPNPAPAAAAQAAGPAPRPAVVPKVIPAPVRAAAPALLAAERAEKAAATLEAQAAERELNARQKERAAEASYRNSQPADRAAAREAWLALREEWEQARRDWDATREQWQTARDRLEAARQTTPRRLPPQLGQHPPFPSKPPSGPRSFRGRKGTRRRTREAVPHCGRYPKRGTLLISVVGPRVASQRSTATSGTVAGHGDKMTRGKRRMLWALGIIGALVLLPVLLFLLNGLVLADRHTPRVKHLKNVTPTPSRSRPGQVTIVSYNIAKAFAHKGGMKFESPEAVEECLQRMAEVIRAERPDLVFLSEALTELAPCNVNQVEYLARECWLPHVATGEDYNVGVPFYRVVGGNAILSRQPLTPVANIDLVGRKPFWVTENNRRALFVSAQLGGKQVLLGALHNDSFDMRNNTAQVQQLLNYVGDRPTILAGDFNNRPEDQSIQLIKASGKFGGEFDGPPTFFEGDRKERIDYILVPPSWELLDSKVVADDTSDHRPVMCRFRVKW